MTVQQIGKRIVVAMSGGVDSSVAALVLKSQGYEPVGVSLQVWDYRSHGGCASRASCCAPSDFQDARKVASALGIPYYVYDFAEVFRREVIDLFVADYSAGKTPNPCIDCNQRVKFGELRRRAAALGASEVATGHYARIEKRADGFHLLRGTDAQKDQSYFLYGLTQGELARTKFPVGAMNKHEVRALARNHGLAVSEKPESQDICFVSGDLGTFLEEQGVKARAGKIVTQSGIEIGAHDGIHRYTVGQRKGLRVGGARGPLYVLNLDVAENKVIVGGHAELERNWFYVGALNECLAHPLPDSFECRLQVRYRQASLRARVSRVDATTRKVEFLDNWTAVSPGQAAVFYDPSDSEVWGGGRIMRDEEFHARACS